MRFLLALLFLLPLAAADLDDLPVLHQGRVKPLAVAAEESLYAIAGTGRLPYMTDATSGLLMLLKDPQAISDLPLVYIPWLDLRPKLGLPLVEQRASLHQVERLRPELQAVVERKQRLDQSGRIEAWSADDEALMTLASRYSEAISVVSGQTILLAPLAISDSERAWVTDVVAPKLATAATTATELRPWHDAVRTALAKPNGLAEANIWLSYEDLVRSPDPLLADAPVGLQAVLRAPLDAAVLHARQSGVSGVSSGVIRAELIYHRSHPFTIAWIGFILGGLAVAAGLGTRPVWYRVGLALTSIAIAATVAGLAVRTVITGLGAVTNLFETFIFVALIVAILGVWFAQRSGQGLYAVAGGIGAGLCAMIGEAMPPDLGSHIGQLQPVLRSKFWLWIHVKVVVAAYAPLVLALVLGNVVLWKAWRAGRAVTLVESKNLYRCLQWGTVLMAAGTLLGAVWADQAWGRFWGWDPKEVGALIIILVYLIPLHLRYVGSVGPTGLAAWAVLGFLSVVWSWYGVNFILGAGLHAYAFGNGGQHIVLPLAALQVVLTTWQLVSIKRALKAGARERGSEGASAGAEPPRAPGVGE